MIRDFTFLISITLCFVSCKFNKHITEIKNENLIIYPPTSTSGELINHKYYSLSYSEEDEQAEWVAYKIISNDLYNISRTNDFREDPFVKSGSSDLTDYAGSGYDRGHLAPAASMSVNQVAMSESFYLSNICPQVPEFNRGIWKGLESKVRYWAKSNDSLYVVTGPILNRPMDIIGDNDVTVPRAFYKTIVGFKNKEINGIGFLVPNKGSNKSICSYAVSIDSIEQVTGIDFFQQMTDSIQLRIEKNENLEKIILN